eukprot:TRINITY_DN25078_c0_g1_i8.p2 TRINITY_DN25078_c0_g1~~TRINITY_DN25078_c0_g1_i8.p2  ORF type:complete len:225 (+),score=11.99 TRINITY_DN25078_c0_g1_i8:194-868(+)
MLTHLSGSDGLDKSDLDLVALTVYHRYTHRRDSRCITTFLGRTSIDPRELYPGSIVENGAALGNRPQPDPHLRGLKSHQSLFLRPPRLVPRSCRLTGFEPSPYASRSFLFLPFNKTESPFGGLLRYQKKISSMNPSGIHAGGMNNIWRFAKHCHRTLTRRTIKYHSQNFQLKLSEALLKIIKFQNKTSKISKVRNCDPTIPPLFHNQFQTPKDFNFAQREKPFF